MQTVNSCQRKRADNALKVILLNLDSIITGAALIIPTGLVLVNVFMGDFMKAPIIADGLLTDKKDVMAAFSAGVDAV